MIIPNHSISHESEEAQIITIKQEEILEIPQEDDFDTKEDLNQYLMYQFGDEEEMDEIESEDNEISLQQRAKNLKNNSGRKKYPNKKIKLVNNRYCCPVANCPITYAHPNQIEKHLSVYHTGQDRQGEKKLLKIHKNLYF